jgi:hypothetical protein
LRSSSRYSWILVDVLWDGHNDYNVLHSVVQCRHNLGSKPNWCCNICGDHFSRRFSANRHIRLKHGGSGEAIPFTHYIAGIRTGIYPPFPRPTFNRTDPSQQIILEEFQREVARDSVKKYLYGSSFAHPKPAFITSRFLPGLPFILQFSFIFDVVRVQQYS